MCAAIVRYNRSTRLGSLQPASSCPASSCRALALSLAHFSLCMRSSWVSPVHIQNSKFVCPVSHCPQPQHSGYVNIFLCAAHSSLCVMLAKNEQPRSDQRSTVGVTALVGTFVCLFVWLVSCLVGLVSWCFCRLLGLGLWSLLVVVVVANELAVACEECTKLHTHSTTLWSRHKQHPCCCHRPCGVNASQS